MSKRKGILLFIIVFLAIIALWRELFKENTPPTEVRDYPQIEKNGTLRVVTDYNSIGYYASGDTVTGFIHDLLNLLQANIPLKIEVSLESNLDQNIEGIKQGKYDILAQNIPITSELRSSLGFTEPVVQNRQVLIQRKKEYNNDTEPIRSHLELAKKTLYVPFNSPVILRIRNLSHEIGDTIFIKEDPLYSAEQLAMQVASGDINYAVSDEKTAIRVAEAMPEIDYFTLIGFTHLEAWAINKKNLILLDSLNNWINRIKETEEYKKIYTKYYN